MPADHPHKHEAEKGAKAGETPVIVAPRRTPAWRLEKALKRAGYVDEHVAHEKEERGERRNVSIECGDENSDFADNSSDQNGPSRLARTWLASCNRAKKGNNSVASDTLQETRRACETLQT